MKVLIGCETSGTVRNAFLEKGFDTWSCDILPADDQTNRHIQDDVRDVLKMEAWDLLMVAHPPCTRLCNSGVRWLHNPPEGKTVEEMWQELDEGTALFSDLWNADVPRIAIENPIMHKYAKSRIENFEPFTQSVQPYEFAESIDADDNVTKRTCLWLKNLPKLVKTGSLTKATARHDIHHASPGPDRDWETAQSSQS